MIGHLIDFSTPSEAAISLHEAGHCWAALVLGIPPEFIEFVDDPSLPGSARNRVSVPDQESRKFVACAAFSVELNLYHAERLTDSNGNILSQKQFIDKAVGKNAAEDKRKFFGADHEDAEGFWPPEMDNDFMTVGTAIAKEISMECVFAIAEKLLSERRLDCARIVEIATPYLPNQAQVWCCS